MNLDTTLKSVQVVLGEAASVAPCDVVASYTDNGNGMAFNASNDTVTSGTLDVTAVGAPPQNIERTVTEVTVFNADNISHTAFIALVVSGAARVMQEGTIAPGETLIYATPPRIGP